MSSNLEIAKGVYEKYCNLGGDPNGKIFYGGVPERSPILQLFVSLDLLDCVERLLRDGADPNARGYAGRTPIHYCDSIAMLHLLRHFGADINAPDRNNYSPLANAGFRSLEYQKALALGGAKHTDERRRDPEIDADRQGKRARRV